MNNFRELNTSLVREPLAAVQGLLSRVNPYVSIHRPAIETCRLSEAAARAAGSPDAENRRVLLRASYTPGPRRFNASAAAMEVAAILPDTNEEARDGREIVVHDSPRDFMRISATHPTYEPLGYTILNATCVSGWCSDTASARSRAVVPMLASARSRPVVPMVGSKTTATREMTGSRHEEAEPGVA